MQPSTVDMFTPCIDPVYLTSNEPLPERLHPTLDRHLSCLSQAIDNVDAEMAELEQPLLSAMNRRASLKETQRLYLSTKSGASLLSSSESSSATP
jgi:uncharacterized protein YecT (DUF1311 family)